MNRRVKVRRIKNSPYSLVYSDPPPKVDLDQVAANFHLTRIWMGIVPAESVHQDQMTRTYPGYACVIGEIYRSSQSALEDRPRILLDEGTCLDPKDFTDEECADFHISEKEAKFPTLFGLRRAAVSLKDIWWPSLVIVPPVQSFYGAILGTDGLYQYAQEVSDSDRQQHYPFYQSKGRLADGVLKAELEDREYGNGLINALFSQDLFQVVTDCSLFLDEKIPTAYRAVGMVLSMMQQIPAYLPWSERQTLSVDADERESLEVEHDPIRMQVENAKWLFGGPELEDAS